MNPNIVPAESINSIESSNPQLYERVGQLNCQVITNDAMIRDYEHLAKNLPSYQMYDKNFDSTGSINNERMGVMSLFIVMKHNPAAFQSMYMKAVLKDDGKTGLDNIGIPALRENIQALGNPSVVTVSPLIEVDYVPVETCIGVSVEVEPVTIDEKRTTAHYRINELCDMLTGKKLQQHAFTTREALPGEYDTEDEDSDTEET